MNQPIEELDTTTGSSNNIQTKEDNKSSELNDYRKDNFKNKQEEKENKSCLNKL